MNQVYDCFPDCFAMLAFSVSVSCAFCLVSSFLIFPSLLGWPRQPSGEVVRLS